MSLDKPPIGGIDIETETLLGLRAACREPVFCSAKSGKPLHISGMYRLIQRGARTASGDRIRLEVIRTPSGLRTSREAIARFIAALTDPLPTLPRSTAKARTRAVDDACAELAAAGFEVEAPSSREAAGIV